MFRERLNEIIKAIGVSNGTLAEHMGCDRSIVSRLRTGNRTPLSTGSTVQRLVRALYEYADETNAVPELCAAVGCEPDGHDTVVAALTEYLCEGVESRRRTRRRGSPAFRSFGEKLSGSMELGEFTNIRLAKALSLDASTISRFRSGLRTPRSNMRLVNTLCALIYDRITELGKLKELSELTGIHPDLLSPETYRQWLCDFESGDTGDEAERLLETIDAFEFSPAAQLPDARELITDELLNETAADYFGTEGLRRAVLRFLGTVVARGGRELWLYSDQNMDWMVGDPVFRMKWASLMLATVKSGVRIRIIHNVDRDVGEMTDAIVSWLPLYMTGMIESWYSRRTRDGRFANTLFVAPGIAAIQASVAVGCEEFGVYRYYTEERSFLFFAAEFNTLLSSSKPLVTVSRRARTYDPGEELITLSGDLPDWRFVSQSELVPAEAVEKADRELIEEIMRRSDENTGYRLYILPENPFPNTRVTLTSTDVAVTRTVEPGVTFTITHPAMLDAFRAYLDRLRERYREDKLSQRRRLEEA